MSPMFRVGTASPLSFAAASSTAPSPFTPKLLHIIPSSSSAVGS